MINEYNKMIHTCLFQREIEFWLAMNTFIFILKVENEKKKRKELLSGNASPALEKITETSGCKLEKGGGTHISKCSFIELDRSGHSGEVVFVKSSSVV